jgi:hypothetical protein
VYDSPPANWMALSSDVNVLIFVLSEVKGIGGDHMPYANICSGLRKKIIKARCVVPSSEAYYYHATCLWLWKTLMSG